MKDNRTIRKLRSDAGETIAETLVALLISALALVIRRQKLLRPAIRRWVSIMIKTLTLWLILKQRHKSLRYRSLNMVQL